ncbi:hypothetical protein [Amnibacterium kyonggiense]
MAPIGISARTGPPGNRRRSSDAWPSFVVTTARLAGTSSAVSRSAIRAASNRRHTPTGTNRSQRHQPYSWSVVTTARPFVTSGSAPIHGRNRYMDGANCTCTTSAPRLAPAARSSAAGPHARPTRRAPAIAVGAPTWRMRTSAPRARSSTASRTT